MQSLSDLPWCLLTADPASYVCPGLRASASHVFLKGSSLQGRDKVTGYGGLSQVSRTSPNGTEKDKAGQEQVLAARTMSRWNQASCSQPKDMEI